MIIDTVIIRNGAVIAKHDQGEETRADLLIYRWEDSHERHDRHDLADLCRRLAALAVQERQQAEAVPDLLAACKAAEAFTIQRAYTLDFKTCEILRAAIAKAEKKEDADDGHIR